MFILKILFAPLSLILSLFVWLCVGLLSCSGFVFKLASGLLSLLAFAVLITYSAKNGIILFVLAFLISPMGLPLLAVQGLGKLQDVNTAMKNFIYKLKAQAGANASACFSKIVVYFLANFGYNISKKEVIT